jgi:hypothetical protein
VKRVRPTLCRNFGGKPCVFVVSVWCSPRGRIGRALEQFGSAASSLFEIVSKAQAAWVNRSRMICSRQPLHRALVAC